MWDLEEAQDGSKTYAQTKKSFTYKDSCPEDLIIRNKYDPLRIRLTFRNDNCMLGFISLIEPTSVDEALSDNGWIATMQEELNLFKRNDVWDLVPRPSYKNIIGTNWVLKNKLNEQGEVVRNKDQLVAQGFIQQKGIDFSETFSHMARLEAIRLLLSYDVNHDIILYRMDIKSVFLNGVISDKVYVKQPPGEISPPIFCV